MKTTTFGAFVNLVPGRDGLVHISKLGKGKRLNSVEAVKEGDTDRARRGHRRAGQASASRPVGAEWEAPAGEGSSGGGDGERRPREPREPRNGAERDRGPRRHGKRFRDAEKGSS